MIRFLGFRNRAASAQPEVAQRGSDFVRNAFPVDKRNARYISLVRVLPVRRGWSGTTVTKIRGERARVHVQRVHVPRGWSGRFRQCRQVQADCDCMRFMFVWNYALLEKGLAVRDRTNGEPPDETNPEQVLGCCKHLIILLRYLWNDNPQYPPNDARGDGRAIRLTTVREARTR